MLPQHSSVESGIAMRSRETIEAGPNHFANKADNGNHRQQYAKGKGQYWYPNYTQTSQNVLHWL